jgi:hypothetical protein
MMICVRQAKRALQRTDGSKRQLATYHLEQKDITQQREPRVVTNNCFDK